ncbi:hypothetical protein KIN20_020808 [Parelaphostrongylus tenuis]|uniref:Uncharacterized protein n=1 Tax=Parelaphostrongylus tenuis TaxID=148309 RepID=A0AAD5N751_PARTN|nr:hypothetical protein KIN20_020808 [Parelaphostrongylus tenuis]
MAANTSPTAADGWIVTNVIGWGKRSEKMLSIIRELKVMIRSRKTFGEQHMTHELQWNELRRSVCTYDKEQD